MALRFVSTNVRSLASMPAMKSLPRLLSALFCLVFSLSASAAETLVYFGTYTRGDSGSEGIYVSRFNSESGELSAPELAVKTTNPSFVALHLTKPLLYAVSEVSGSNGKPAGAVSAFSIDKTSGKLTLLNSQPSGGAGPCHVSTDSKGLCLLVANYGAGSCASLGISVDGTLKPASSVIQHAGMSINQKRQREPHAHSANPGPNDRFAFVADLGIDKVQIYRLDPAAATLKEAGFVKVVPGSGPRHFAFHPNGKNAYVINELALTITAFDFDPEKGTLTPIQNISTVPNNANRVGLSTAEVQVHSSGKFVYGSNRGHDTIAAFKVGDDGKLSLIEIEPIQGETPRNFGIDPSGNFLLAAGQKSGTISVFRINQETGELDFTGSKIEVGAPVCVKFFQP
jgi:6-phosphogluconolactonase